MRKHGWQLPYHPLQVVAIAVFLALGFAFYVFFVPFVGERQFQYVVTGLYTPLVACVFCLYIWCAAADPGDPGVFTAKKYLNIVDNDKLTNSKKSRQEAESISSMNALNEANAVTVVDKPSCEAPAPDTSDRKSSNEFVEEKASCCIVQFFLVLLGRFPLSFGCSGAHLRQQSPEQQMSEDGMFYCSLCEVEVYKYSKHCRVCDKCVDGFDHHCRWLNNCIGRKNYQRFFILMISALLLLIIQCSIGVLVLIRCFLTRRRFTMDIASKLGSSFSLVPFVVVVGSCTFLAMVATLPLAQLFFFHVLLIKKGISTYDYIIALREQEQQGLVGQQSPQMSPVSSLTGLSSASSFTAFRHGSWCTPPRLFLEDQLDVVPPDTGMSGSSQHKRMLIEESTRKKNPGTVKISPWTLARLNAEEVTKAAAQARKKSRILQPVVRRDNPLAQETDSSYGSGSGRMTPKLDNRRRTNKRGRPPTGFPLEPLAKISASATDNNGSALDPETSTSLAPLQLEARSAFHTSRAMSFTGIVTSSPDSSLDSPDLQSFAVSSTGAEGGPAFTSLPSIGSASQKGIPLSRSTSDGYEASGGEDSDRIPSRIVHRSTNWTNLLFSSSHVEATERKASSGGLQTNIRLL